jgi:NAD-dependent SIR2 family protein deacetylase
VQTSNIFDTIYDVRDAFGSPIGILVGAGLSVPLPTALPLQPEILRSLMNLDWLDGSEKYPIKDSELLDMVNKKIRLEHLLSIYKEWGNHDVGDLLRQFGEAEPNYYHAKIAELVRENVVNRILTTNFDLCLEKALIREGISFSQITDERSFKEGGRREKWIVKLHGTICPTGSASSSSGLIATLESMFKSIDPWKITCLREVVNNNGLLCLGYSGRDSFDINPIIRQMENKKIVWVLRSLDSSKNKDIKETLEKSSMFKLPVICNTASFLGATTKFSGPEKSSFKFNKICSLNDGWHPSVFIGRVLENSRYDTAYEAAINYYLYVLNNCDYKKYLPHQIVDMFRSVGVCYFELGDPRTSLKYLEKCNELIIDLEDNKDKRYTNSSYKYILIDERRLLCEEKINCYYRIKDFSKAQNEEDDLDKIINELKEYYVEKPSDYARSIINISAGRIFRLEKSKAPREAYQPIAARLSEASDIERHHGDIIGYLIGRINQSRAVFNYDPYGAINITIDLFATLRKLSGHNPEDSVIGVKAVNLAIKDILSIYIYALEEKFDRKIDVDKVRLSDAIEEIKAVLFGMPLDSLNKLNSRELINKLLADNNLRESLSSVP